ncbi:RNA polymerase sigma factor [Myceligenerans pegani]|uniref:SigE family RNA polymerase sigma factor n=1 Tax=Myceligenerans pegani TaxID=2776917 RepID=A0ABR9N0B6_9MICO|nr:SigE family RNA polymerase sigma factor [Myceligenerans sp. TRM 65318]MBE1876681.1 SigE family RNA polymerase sigma factor [Myceligenerans sp. TRM 65318]MBE3018952.1 SigE family RNA polymerase sigma factor [Myceligenerans sp. TRM 65318]
MTVWLSTAGPHGAPTHQGARTPAPGVEAAGSAPALHDVVREHLPGLIRYANALVGDQHTAADLVQEVLLRAHQRWHRIARTDRPDLYLRRMVTNEHLSWRRRWHVRTIRPAPDDELVKRGGTSRDHAEHHAEQDAMWHRLERLPARQRTVLVLRYYEGLKDAEIAAVLGTSAATVRSHASRALGRLRRTDPTTEETR